MGKNFNLAFPLQPKETEEFVAAMEDILDVYTGRHDKKHPLVCADEFPRQLIGEVRTPIPVEPGKPARFDTEYSRNGICEVFMFAAPLEGWRRAEVTEQRTKTDWAHQIKKLVTVDFPDAEKIVLVHDNLNTHTNGTKPATKLQAKSTGGLLQKMRGL